VQVQGVRCGCKHLAVGAGEHRCAARGATEGTTQAQDAGLERVARGRAVLSPPKKAGSPASPR
jgi:hypothetical protein